MDSKELCRKCCFLVADYVTNMTYDKHGKYVRCPKCLDFERKMDHHRREWNQRVVWHVKRLDPELQDYYKCDLQHGDLRTYLYSMREGGKSPAEAVRAWRHKIMYLETAAGRIKVK